MIGPRKGTFTYRLSIALGVAGLMAATVMPSASAQNVSTSTGPSSGPIVDVANPLPGAYVRRGKMFIYGDACDPSAPAGSGPAGTGIRKVSAFFGDRDSTEGHPVWRPGGYLGAATIINNFPQPASELGLPTTSPLCKDANAGFQVLTASLRKGTWDLNIYVLSVTGKETHLVIPGIRVDKP